MRLMHHVELAKSNIDPELYCPHCEEIMSEEITQPHGSPQENMHRWYCTNMDCAPRFATNPKDSGPRIFLQPHRDPQTRLIVRLPKVLNLTDGITTSELVLMGY